MTPEPTAVSETRDVVILGSGCAGLTATIYAGRSNLKPLVRAARVSCSVNFS
jgi:thioredoxin reductase